MRSWMVMCLLAGCGDKDGDDTATSGDGGAASDGGSAGDGGSGGDGGASSDAAFFASGTYDGASFAVDCAFDDSDPAWTAGLQCQDGIQFFIWCRPDPDDAAIADLPPDQFQVWFYLHNEIASPGTHDLVGNNGLCVGNTMASPLCTNSQNIESASLTVDSSTLWTAASGSFSATWNDSGDEWAGDHTATLSGSFDFTCP